MNTLAKYLTDKFRAAFQFFRRPAANTAAAGGPGAGGSSPFGQGAPILASRPDASQPTPSAPGSPDDVISAKSRAFWQGRGISLPWWGAQPAAPGAPRALGILPAQAPQAPAGPGSVSDYEARMGLSNVPSNPPAPNYVPPMQQGQKAPMPAGGESADAFEQRLGLAPVPPQRNVVIDNAPQGRSAQQYADSLRLSAADQIAQDAKNKRLTKAQRGW